MTETQIDTLRHTTPREPDLMTSTSRPFIPEVLPSDHLPKGIPMPNPEVARALQQAGGKTMVDRIGLRHLRREGKETVFPVCVTGNGDVPIFSSISRDEFTKRYGFIPESLFIDALREYAHATAMITGGADTGLETARVLQAVAIYKHARPSDRPRLDSKLQKDYGLPKLPSAYAQKLALLDEALAADDQGSRALGFLSDTGATPLEAARDVVIKNPGLFLAHLIRTITLWPRAAEVQNLGPLVDQLERIVGSAMEANLGQLLFRNDFVYPDINTAVSLLGDLEMALRYPKLHEVADAVLIDRYGIPREVRHNGRYFTALFSRFLVDRGIVREEGLDAGDIITRASVKTPASLLGKAVVSPRVMDSIFDGAEAMGLDVHRPDAASPRATKASWGIRTLSQMLDPRVLKNLTEEMMAQDDVIRARVDFKKPEMLNWSLGKIRGVLGTYPPKAREIL